MPTKPQKRSKSNQRILMERLERARLKPRAWMVALVLEAYGRIERSTGRRISSLYHQKIAGITGMSVENVRRALGELTKGPHPLYRKRNATGAQHTIYGNNGFELTTTGAIYEWIDDVPGGAASSATSQAVPPLSAAPARGRGYKHTPQCLTANQVEQFAVDVCDDPSYGEMLPDGEKRIAEYHALRRHVIDGDCDHCQLAVAVEIALQAPEEFIGVQLDQRCGCGQRVARKDDKAFDLWDFAIGDCAAEHRCDTAGAG